MNEFVTVFHNSTVFTPTATLRESTCKKNNIIKTVFPKTYIFIIKSEMKPSSFQNRFILPMPSKHYKHYSIFLLRGCNIILTSYIQL